MFKILILVIFMVFFSGCNSLPVNGVFRPPEYNQMKPGKNGEIPDASIFAPITENELLMMIPKSSPSVLASQGLIYDSNSETNFEAALTQFYLSFCTTPSSTCNMVRDRIQDRIIITSNLVCRNYKVTLKQYHSTENIMFGSVSTVLAGAGALSTGATAARILSGAAGITTGVNSQVNQNVYSTLAVEIITKAIDKARADALEKISDNRKLDINHYNIEKAIAEADEYHGKCSLIAGLQEASTAVSQAGTPNTAALDKTLTDLGQSVSIQLGKRNFDVFTKDVLAMKDICSFGEKQISDYITQIKADDKQKARKNWDTFVANICPGTALDADFAKTYESFTNTSDVASKQNLADRATYTQNQIKNYKVSLEQELAAIKLTYPTPTPIKAKPPAPAPVVQPTPIVQPTPAPAPTPLPPAPQPPAPQPAPANAPVPPPVLPATPPPAPAVAPSPANVGPTPQPAAPDDGGFK